MQKNPFFSPWNALLATMMLTLVGAGCASSSPAEDLSSENPNTSETAIDTTSTSATPEKTADETKPENTQTAPTTSGAQTYADGTYSATGTYTSPGGKEELPVTLTLKDGIITEASVETPAKNPASQRWQKVFSENFKPLVVGKSIEDVDLDVVSGSSLTPKGFNDALEKIAAEARS